MSDAGPDAVDEFDALLSPTPPTTSASARPGAEVAHEVDLHPAHAEPPTLDEFFSAWDLYQDPVLAGVLAGVALGVAGVFVVLRRAVFVTAAISQAAGLGVACAFLLAIHTGLELPPVALAFAFALLGALALGLRPPRRLPREAAVGFVYLAASALAVIVGDRISQEAHDLASILFGSAVLVRRLDLWLVGAVGAISVTVLLALSRALSFSGFDPDTARVQGLPVRRLEAALWLCVAGVVAVATRALGALPVFAFAVLPALASLRLARRLPQTLALAALLGGVSGATGYLAAFLLELPVGASQASVAALLAAVCWAVGWGR